MLYGQTGFERLQKANVAVVGMGGVGSYAAEALVRAGVGGLRIIDCDVVTATDVNRQLFALSTNVDSPKVEAGRTRLLSINPDLRLDTRHAFFHSEGRLDSALLGAKDSAYLGHGRKLQDRSVQDSHRHPEPNHGLSFGAGSSPPFSQPEDYRRSACGLLGGVAGGDLFPRGSVGN